MQIQSYQSHVNEHDDRSPAAAAEALYNAAASVLGDIDRGRPAREHLRTALRAIACIGARYHIPLSELAQEDMKNDFEKEFGLINS